MTFLPTAAQQAYIRSIVAKLAVKDHANRPMEYVVFSCIGKLLDRVDELEKEVARLKKK